MIRMARGEELSSRRVEQTIQRERNLIAPTQHVFLSL